MELNSHVLRHLILLRVSCDSDMGVGMDAVRRDLAPFVEHRLSPTEWRGRYNQEIEALLGAGLLERGPRKVLFPGPGIRDKVERFLDLELGSNPDWLGIKNHALIALALNLTGSGRVQIRALGGVRALRVAILQSGYGLRIKRGQSEAALRNALAGLALERGFGEKFKIIARGRLSIAGRAGRLIAAQLLTRPREFNDDGQLIAELAAEKTGAVRTNLAALRLALWRQLVTRKAEPGSDFSSDLKLFSEIVHTKAKERAKGWPGNRRAYISHVWNSIRTDCPELCLNEGRFKSLLAEAHRAGHVNLINADLRNRKNMTDLKASAVNYKNTEWHFIRVDE